MRGQKVVHLEVQYHFHFINVFFLQCLKRDLGKSEKPFKFQISYQSCNVRSAQRVWLSPEEQSRRRDGARRRAFDVCTAKQTALMPPTYASTPE